jgi:S1-C subfamily serine protease
MKKFLFFVLTLAIFILAAQRFGLLNYFYNTPSEKSSQKGPSNNTPTAPSQKKVKPLIGIYYRMIDKQTALQNKLVEGAYITQIIKGSPAEKAGLQEEDIVLQLDDKKISGTELKMLTKLIAEKKPGDKVLLKIWRNKEIKTISLILALDQ